MIKSNEEIEIIKNGARIADIGGEEIVKNIKEGATELEIAISGRDKMEREIAYSYPNAEYMDTWVWFQSGINTDGAHNPKTNRKLKNGDILSLNTFPMISGYYTALERTLFLNSVDRVASVSLDKKDGVKFNLSKDTLDLSVNNTNSGDGKETLSVNFDHDLEISFNSRYLIDVASQLDGDRVEIFFNDTGSPALIKDPGDFDSIFVVMPMKG